MKIVDAFTGRAVSVGDVVPSPGGRPWKLLDTRDAFFRVWALVSEVPDVLDKGTGASAPRWTELQVRFTHPKYFMQRVAFVPS
jgi:hypothetical protein